MIFILLVTGLKTNKTDYQKHLIHIEKNIVVLLKTAQNPTHVSFMLASSNFFFKRLFMIFMKAII